MQYAHMHLLHHSKCSICGLRSELAEAVAQHQHILYPTKMIIIQMNRLKQDNCDCNYVL